MPDFRMQQQFPIAAVIDAAQKKGQLDNQTTLQQSQLFDSAMDKIGTVSQSLLDKRRRVAQSLAIGKQFDIPDNLSSAMEPDQVLKVGATKQGQGSMVQYMLTLHPELANNPQFIEAISGKKNTTVPSPATPGASLPRIPTNVPMALSPKPEATLASASPTIPMPAHTESAATMPFGGASTPTVTAPPVPVPIAAPPVNPFAGIVDKPLTKGTIGMIKMGMANRPESVFQYTPGQGLQKVGEKGKGDQVITSQPGTKESNHEDTLEQNAINRIASIRGDPSLGRIESQRDAAAIAYNTIQKAKNEGRDITQTEYYDTLGQLWKARTGSSPTDQAIKDLDINTIQGALNKKLTWVDGKPRGATSQEVVNVLQRFIDDSGNQADKLHEGYMKPRLIKPYGLSPERWKAIQESGRGMTYSEATKESRSSTPKASGTTVTPNGTAYTVN